MTVENKPAHFFRVQTEGTLKRRQNISLHNFRGFKSYVTFLRIFPFLSEVTSSINYSDFSVSKRSFNEFDLIGSKLHILSLILQFKFTKKVQEVLLNTFSKHSLKVSLVSTIRYLLSCTPPP